jgi:hypothetical protein
MMQTKSTGEEHGMVLVIGGNGGMTNQYRAVIEERGYELRHYEKRVPPAAKRNGGKIALVVVMVTMVSHALLAHAKTLAEDTRIVYLRSPSISALRAAVESV